MAFISVFERVDKIWTRALRQLPYWLGLCTVLLSCRCSGTTTDELDLDWKGVARRQGSSIDISNSAALLPDGVVSYRRLWTAPDNTAETESGFWEAPSHVAVGSKTIYVLDPQAHSVHRVSKDGVWIGTFGREGHGPGEFTDLRDIAVLSDQVAVLDGGKAAVIMSSNAGIYLQSIPVGGVGLRILPFGDSRLLVNRYDGESSEWIALVVHEKQTAIEPTRIVPVSKEGCRRLATVEDRLLELDCSVPLLRVSDRQGLIVAEFGIEGDPEEASPTELAQIRGDILKKVHEVGHSAAETKRLTDQFLADLRIKRKFHAVRVDSASGIYALWEQEPEEFGGGPAILHLFADIGVYLTTIHFASSWIDFEFSGERVYALVKDRDTGLVTLSAYRLYLPTIQGRSINDVARQIIQESVD